MPSQKQARAQRRAARLNQRDRLDAFAAAAAERDRALAQLRHEHEPKIAELEARYSEAKRKVWDDYDERRRLIHQATILGAGS